MRELIVGRNWVNLVVALSLAIIPLLMTLPKSDGAKAARLQASAVQVAEITND